MERIKKALDNKDRDNRDNRDKNRSVARDTAEDVNKDVGLLSMFTLALLCIVKVLKSL